MSVYSGNRSKESSLFLPCPFPGKGISGERLPPFIPGFRLTEFCGKGGIGSVWKGKDSKGTPLAFRIVCKKEESSWKKDQESILLYREKIPPFKNLLPILFCGEKRDFCYAVTPLADNLFPGKKYTADTLSNRLKTASYFPIPRHRIFSFMEDLIEAVKVLHKNGLAHNDIKPENILFIKKTPILTDFGLAAPLTEKSRGGTTGYRPPWQDPTGKECDIYALGKILYTLFSGKDASFYPLLQETLPYREEMLFFFNSLILKSCSSEAEKRISSATEFGELFREGKKVFSPREEDSSSC